MAEDSPKRKRRLPVREILKQEAVQAEFKVIDGLRFVVPYHFNFRVYAKKRWFDRQILEVFREEFQAYTSDYYRSALEKGKLTVNDRCVPPDYVLRDHDFITHKIHRHEPPVLNMEIPVIKETDEHLVVCKPPSLPIHTTGRFHHNTILKILELKYKYKLYTCHRLDRLTSGVLILLKNPASAKKHADLFVRQKVAKAYLALVGGKFPEAVEWDKAILRVCHKLGICSVDEENGKPAQTNFTLLHYSRETNRSLVLCEPKSGRMHQIRVHLAHMGYPIINDPIYSRENWAKKSTEEFSSELSKALFATDNISLELAKSKVSGDGVKSSPNIAVNGNGDFVIDNVTYKHMPKLDTQPDCPDCSVIRLIPQKKDMFLYLHAIRYEILDNIYISDLPSWCQEFSIPEKFKEFLGLSGK